MYEIKANWLIDWLKSPKNFLSKEMMSINLLLIPVHIKGKRLAKKNMEIIKTHE